MRFALAATLIRFGSCMRVSKDLEESLEDSVANHSDTWQDPFARFKKEQHAADDGAQDAVSPFDVFVSQSTEVGCPPRVWRSTCGAGLKGQIVFIHGFSGCSDQAEKLGERMSRACYDVLAPTLPGHGVTLNTCASQKCTVQIGRGKGFDLTPLPTHEDEYVNFAKDLTAVVRREQNHRAASVGKTAADLETTIVGFALGAPVALFAVMEEPKVFSRMLLLNPYFAMGDEDTDRKAVECEYEAQIGTGSVKKEDCRREAIVGSLAPFGVQDKADNRYLNWLASSRGSFEKRLFCNLAKMSNAFGDAHTESEGKSMLSDVMESERTWDTVCDHTLKHGRKGFCKFQTKHALALHAFAIRALVDSQAWGKWYNGVPVTQIMTTERDGRTRNGMTYKVAQTLYKKQDKPVHFCMHRFKKGVDVSKPQNYWNDAFSMPHAIMMPKRASGWWENDLYNNIQSFVEGQDSINGPPKESWRGEPSVCTALPLEDAEYRADPQLHELVVPEAASSSKINCVWVGPLWTTVKAYDAVKAQEN